MLLVVDGMYQINAVNRSLFAEIVLTIGGVDQFELEVETTTRNDLMD